MADNNYPEGTLEWAAWGLGNDYGIAHGNDLDAPLSGEWADSPTFVDVIRATWKAVLGQTWDTYIDGTDEDRDYDQDILDAWESGYRGPDA